MVSQALIVAIILTISFILASVLSLNSGKLADEISQLIGGAVPLQTSQQPQTQITKPRLPNQDYQTIDDVIKLLEDELNSATSLVNVSQLKDTLAKQTTATTFASATQTKLPASTPITTSAGSATQTSASSQTSAPSQTSVPSQTSEASTTTPITESKPSMQISSKMTTTQTQQPRIDFYSLPAMQIVAIFVGGLVATIIVLTAATRI